MSMCAFETLLPRATPAELLIEQEFNEKYCTANPEVIKQLHDPWLCPAEFLPWLAFSLSVDVWNDAWPESTKRSVCANSIVVHRHKGTLGGVEDALSALGVRMQIVEWFQKQPVGELGTVDLTLWVNENINPDADVIIDSQVIRDLIRTVDKTKRASVHYTFVVAVEMTTGMRVAHSAQSTALTHSDVFFKSTDINADEVVLRQSGSTQFSSRVTLQTLPNDVFIKPSGFLTRQSGSTQFSSRVILQTLPNDVFIKSSGFLTRQACSANLSVLLAVDANVEAIL